MVFNGLTSATAYDVYVYEQCIGNGEIILGGLTLLPWLPLHPQVKPAAQREIAVYNLSGLAVPFNLNGNELTIPTVLQECIL